MRAMKKLYLDWGAASTQRVNDLNLLDEFHLKSYVSVAFYKKKIKKYHDQMIEKRDFVVGVLVLILTYRLHLFLGKIKFKCSLKFLVKCSREE